MLKQKLEHVERFKSAKSIKSMTKHCSEKILEDVHKGKTFEKIVVIDSPGINDP